MDSAQMLKGLLDGCILNLIKNEESYGYKITEDLNKYGFLELGEGTVYPVLIRLEKKGLLQSEMKKSALGPSRKYFSLTDKGNDYLYDFRGHWQKVSKTVNRIMEGGGVDEL